MLPIADIEEHLAHVRHLKGEHELVDIHVHPFEVIFNRQIYRKNHDHDGVYSSSQASYTPPVIGARKSAGDLPASCRRHINEEARLKCLAFTTRQLYQHTGPRVFEDQMALSGIDRVLLLPVSGPDLPVDEQMHSMFEMFGGHRRFSLGYAVASTTATGNIEAAVAGAVSRYGIKAVKVHPAITGIDLRQKGGMERIRMIMDACRRHGLSLIVHGGRSPDARTVETIDFSMLDRLELVDWGVAGMPVVIAHAGIYGCAGATILSEIRVLRRILEKHDNVMVDISALEHSVLLRILNEIATERIVFGSDALYFPQWTGLAELHHALQRTYSSSDREFIRIASLNARRIIGEYQAACINS